MLLKVFVPRFHQVNGGNHTHVQATQASSEPSGSSSTNHLTKPTYYVYEIEVSTAGKFYRVERRYSQFLALHNELRKYYRTPEFPPKKIRNTSHKLLEQRRQELEAYIQYFIRFSPVPKGVLDFLEVPKTSVNNLFGREKTTHQPVSGFVGQPFLIPPSTNDRLPDIVTQATLDYFYNYT